MDILPAAQVQARIDKARQTYFDLKHELEDVLRPFTTDPMAALNILAYAEEFGADEAAMKLRHEPDSFDVSYAAAGIDEATAIQLENLVFDFADASRDLDFYTTMREDELQRADPKRLRVMVHDGREFTFNPRTKEWRYLDTPGLVYTFPMQRVENRGAPDMSPDDGRARTRRRGRGM
jgi:hypothetical protein